MTLPFVCEKMLRKLIKYLVDIGEVARYWTGRKAIEEYFAVASGVKSFIQYGENTMVFPVSD